MGVEMTSEVWTALYRILGYHWHDEYLDYRALSPKDRAGHIFESLRTVKRWLEDVPQDAEEVHAKDA